MKSPTTEKEYLEQYSIHDYAVPLTTVDLAIFTIEEDTVKVLLVKRANFPAKGKWALPGGFIDLQKDRRLEDAASRKLLEKTGVSISHIEQIETFGSNKRDPRGWSVTIAYMALIANDNIQLKANEHSEEVRWVTLGDIGNQYKLAFDHDNIMQACYARLKSKVQYTSLPVNLMPAEFTLGELQKTFEIILGNDVEKKSFRRRILDAGIIEETGEMKAGSNRPAKLYRVIDEEGKSHLFPRIIEGQR